MGLTIHYHLRLGIRSIAEARQLITQLRQHALDLPLKEVGPLVEFAGDACDFEKVQDDDPNRWLLIQARHHFERGRYGYCVSPRRVIAFSTLPGDGCEQANFGLCLFPGVIEVEDHSVCPHRQRRIRTGAIGWTWGSFCKSQYASRFGTEHFLRCHLCVVAMLDHAKALGILAHVSDEGEFWEKRDVKALAQEVGEWNEMIAAGAGRLKELFGGEVQAPILSHPDFEHLEAKGQRRQE
jgi:hypothetical protein